MDTGQGGNPFIAMLGPEPFENLAARPARGLSKARERRGAEITGDRRGHGAGLGAPGSNLDARGIIECELIGLHEFRRPRQAGQGHSFESSAAEVETWPPMSVDKAVHVFRRTPH